jgi:hypothetical protein
MPRRDDAKLLAMVAELRQVVEVWRASARNHRWDAEKLMLKAEQMDTLAYILESQCDKAVRASEKRPVKKVKEDSKA